MYRLFQAVKASLTSMVTVSGRYSSDRPSLLSLAYLPHNRLERHCTQKTYLTPLIFQL
jgi:hypothetical protein